MQPAGAQSVPAGDIVVCGRYVLALTVFDKHHSVSERALSFVVIAVPCGNLLRIS